LTYPDSDPHTGAVSTADAGEAGGPGTDIAITPEMLQAGVEAFCGYDPRFEGPEDVVPEIFLEMLRAWLKPIGKSGDEFEHKNLGGGDVALSRCLGLGYEEWFRGRG
jgi:hypothetical protein